MNLAYQYPQMNDNSEVKDWSDVKAPSQQSFN
jgi:hypothetical protein